MLNLFFQILKMSVLLLLILVITLLILIILILVVPVKIKIKAKFFKNLNISLNFKLFGITYFFNNFQDESKRHFIKIFGLDILKLSNFFQKKPNYDSSKKDKPTESNHFNKATKNDQYLKIKKGIENTYSTKNKSNKFKKLLKNLSSVDINILNEVYLLFSKIFKTIKIKNLTLFAKYNLKDPFLTGVSLGIFNALIPFFPYDIQIISDFEDEDFDLDFTLDAKTSIFKFIFCIILFLNKKSIKKLIFYKGDLNNE